MRKYDPGSGDPYLDSTTGVLSNRIGARTEQELEAREAAFVAARAYELEILPEAGKFDLAHLQRIHARVFQDVYDWAGQLRTVEIVKGTTVFARRGAIGSAAAQLFRALAAEDHLAGLETQYFSARAGYYLGEINVLHPFRDGNGRAQRMFISQIAALSDYSINWERVSRPTMLRASIEAYNGDSGAMAALIHENLIGL